MTSGFSQDQYNAALRYAATRHKGQHFPGTDLPYIIHPAMVAMEVIEALRHPARRIPDNDLAIAAALLHDVLEDTPTGYDDLAGRFGEKTAAGVLALTKDKAFPSKKDRMADTLKRIKQQPDEIWIVKLADRITNLQAPPGDWPLEKRTAYLDESRLILEELGDASMFLYERLRYKILVYEDDFCGQ